MMATKTFEREVLLDILDDGKDVIRDTVVDYGRWSVGHELIFRHEGQLYSTDYSVGATEMQDEAPWHWDKDVKCEEVRAINRTVTDYVPVEEEK